MMVIKAVAFDIDGTLYSNNAMFLHSIPLGIRFPRLVNHFGKMRKRIRAVESIDNFRKVQASLYADSLGISEEKASSIIEDIFYKRWELMFRGIRPYPHIDSLLKDLKARSVPLAALSDFPVGEKLAYLGLADLFDIAFTSEDTGFLKPHPAPFHELLSRLNLPAENVLYVGNNYKYDVMGANNAGLHTAHICRKPHRDSKADFSFFDFRDLHRFILNHLSG